MDKSSIKILIVDDEPDILEFLKYNFEKENYLVFTANNGLEGIEKAKEIQPQLIILDVMMPQLDGIETCRILRRNHELDNTLILFLTARNEVFSEIAGFEVGADDFVSKPIRPLSLLARVNALLKRRINDENQQPTLKFGDLVIDNEKRLILLEGEKIKLPRKEFEILLFLSQRPFKVFKREEIYHKIWGNDIIVGDRTLDVHIRKLRKNIGNDYIKTSKGIGYAFNYNA